MNATNPDDPKRSFWDKLPQELKDIILDFSSPLTQFLNGRFKQLDNKTKLQLWLEAFQTDWHGDLSLLPTLPAGSDGLLNDHLSAVSSRSMYDRLCKQFPSATETSDVFDKLDAVFESFHATNGTQLERHVHHYANGRMLRLLHIPMRNMWLTDLHESINTHPIARAKDCIRHGHTDLLRHLVNSKKLDLKSIKNVSKPIHTNPSVLAMNYAASHGHLDILIMLHNHGCHSITKDALNDAAAKGYLEVVKWLIENRSEGQTSSALVACAYSGQANIVEYLIHELREEPSPNALKVSKTSQIAKMLVDCMSIACRHEMLDIALRDKWHVHVVEAIQSSLVFSAQSTPPQVP